MNKLFIILDKYEKYLKYLLYFGITLLVAAASASIITAKVSPIYLILIILGIVSILLSLINQIKDFLSKKSAQAGTNALITTISIIIIILLINLLTSRYNFRLDLTENQILSLAPQSQEIVQNLPQKLKVWVFTRDVNLFDKELLENYSRHGKNFSFEFVDPEIKIEIAQQFNIQNIGEVYLEYQDKRNLITTLNSNENLSEILITNAIESIQKQETTQIYFLQGHGEATLDNQENGLSRVVSNLEAKGNIVESINLATTSAIPEQTDLIIIPGPQKELFPGEINALESYLNSGKSLMVMLDPGINTGLEPLLDKWGIALDQRLLIDGSGKGETLGLGPATIIITDYGNHPITQNFGNNISVFPLARHSKIIPTLGIQATPILITNQQTWAETDLTGKEVRFNEGIDLPSPLYLGVALVNEKTNSRLVFIGNSTFATNSWIGQQFNQDLFLNSINWLSQDDNVTLSIAPREAKNRRINLNQTQSLIISLLALFLLPISALTTSGIIWWQRR
jgi:ABC-type uncharacterized transport system involved in gliding motility auxiliary subunit